MKELVYKSDWCKKVVIVSPDDSKKLIEEQRAAAKILTFTPDFLKKKSEKVDAVIKKIR